ncbi:MAG: HIT family protein [Gemmatimonadota bacterium]
MQPGCPFCEVEPERIRLEAEVGLAIRDLFPVADGHLLVIPRRHVASLYDLTASEQTALWDLTRDARNLLIDELRPDGFTIGLNEGMAAGQSVDHSHLHVIPRYLGDVPDPTGGIRAIFPHRARYWERR